MVEAAIAPMKPAFAALRLGKPALAALRLGKPEGEANGGRVQWHSEFRPNCRMKPVRIAEWAIATTGDNLV